MTARFDQMDAYAAHFASVSPEREAIVDGRLRLSYGELNAAVDGLAHWLLVQGVRPGARVAIGAAPGAIYYVGLLATSRIGAIYVGLNPRYTAPEIAHVLTLTQPELILLDLRTDPGFKARVDAAWDVHIHGISSFDDLPREEGAPLAPAAQSRDIAVIVFTSGSTGKPKGAGLHHSGLIDAAHAQSDLADGWDDGAQPRYLSNLPTNHVGAIMNLTLAALVRGGALVFQAKFDAADTLRLLAEERVTTWLQVPAMFTMCVAEEGFGDLSLPDLRTLAIGGGPVSAPTLAALRGLGADIFVEYGQTETMSSLTCSGKTDSDEVLLGTVGRFDPRIDARIAGPDGGVVAQGEVGEVQARGDCTLRLYWNDPEATAEVFTDDGWLKTGDLGRQREDGRIVLVGRAREMIKSGGYNVYPREVEQVLEQAEAVREVVVFGAPDHVFVERVEAAIEIADPARPPDPATLEALCRESLAGYKIPRAFHVAEVLPRLPNGKLDRTGIRKTFS